MANIKEIHEEESLIKREESCCTREKIITFKVEKVWVMGGWLMFSLDLQCLVDLPPSLTC